MSFIKKLLPIMIFASSLYSQTAFTYVVFRASTTQIISESTLTNYGYKFSDMQTIKGQPFRMTSFFIPDNTNYLLISIAPKPGAQQTAVNNIVSQGYAVLISSQDTGQSWNRRYNCFDTVGSYWKVRDLPADFYGVIISTP